MDVIKLKNGSEEAAPLVTVTMHSLAALLEEKPIHFFELVEAARKPGHRPFGKTGDDLEALALLQPGGGYARLDSQHRAVRRAG